jgi:drug/metabolite transporter (DMT)-like permease
MDWLLLSLVCACFTSTGETFSKFLMRENDEWTTGWAVILVSLPFVTPLLALRPVPPVGRDLALLLCVQIPFEVAAYYLYLQAIKIAPLSLTVPYLSFTPVFSMITAAVLLGESVSLQGFFGILMVTVGAYVLNMEESVRHPLAPMKAILRSPGSRRMLVVALIWSLTSTLGKKGVQLSDPVFFGVAYMALLFISLTFITGWRLVRKGVAVNFRGRNVLWLTLAGLATALAMISHFHAIELVQVSYMISVKRTSLIFSVLCGGLVFKEEHIRLRLAGTCVMLSGVVAIYLAP